MKVKFYPCRLLGLKHLSYESTGLYITRNLVEAHGGRIWTFNNNDGI